MMIKILRILVFSISLVLAGCGWLLGDDGFFRDKSGDYKMSPEFEVMDVPSGQDPLDFRESYPIPQVKDSLVLSNEDDVPRPTPITANAGEDVVRIQRLTQEQWALVEVSPGRLWPKVRAFLTAAKLPLGRIDARQGIIETDWLQLKDQDLLSRFQFRIDRGVQRGSSELHILQMNQSGEAIWPQKSDDSSQENQMLIDVAQFIANSTESDSVSMIADSSISSSGRIKIMESVSGKFYLSLGLSFNRSWASVERALEKSFFEVTDRNRSEGIYFITYMGPDSEDGGWFDWLWGGEEKHPLAGKQLLLKVDRKSEEEVNISIRTVEEDPQFDIRQEQALLSLLKGNIS